MRKTTIAALAIVAMTVTAFPASAAEGEARTIRVSYADLDLSQASDVTTLKRRVTREIRHACRVSFSPDIIDTACERDARERAMAEIERHRVRYAALEASPAG